MLGFAAGVMTAASFFSLLSPAIEHCEELNLLIPDESVNNPILVAEHFYTE